MIIHVKKIGKYVYENICHTNTHADTCKYIYMYVSTYVHTCKYICTYMYVHMFISTYVCT